MRRLQLSDRNTPRSSPHEELFTSKYIRKTTNLPSQNDEKTKFENETKELYKDLLEKQRQELSVFDRNYRLDNKEVVDDATNISSIQDINSREAVLNLSYRVKHEYNIEKSKILKRHQKEQDEFWKNRNEQKKQIYSTYESPQTSGYQSKPRSVYSSRRGTPAASPFHSQYDIKTDTVTFGNNDSILKEKIIPRSIASQQSTRETQNHTENTQNANGFFMPRFSRVSQTNKYGNFRRRKPLHYN